MSSVKKNTLPPKKSLMIQGTGSHVGKSLIVAGICRIFRQDDIKVAPFKSQNMALNSYVTPEGREMGRAQVLQAAACKINPHTNMNPILLKPNGNGSSHVMVEGKFFMNLSYADFYKKRSILWTIVKKNFSELLQKHEFIVIEGAGSPAEINLMKREIANMAVARMTNSPVILVGDIDRGGVFASFVGTLQLLPKEDRKRIKGLIINKFRGDKELLKPAIDFISNKTKIPVLGVVDYIDDLQLDDEDSVSLEGLKQNNILDGNVIDIAVIKLPLISNYTDFESLKSEPDVHLRYVNNKAQFKKPDVLIIPGSKNVISDFYFLEKSGLEQCILDFAKDDGFVLGICGGYQMLGKTIADPYGVESKAGSKIRALGLLDIDTVLTANKKTKQIRAKLSKEAHMVFGKCESEINGYEIHVGKTDARRGEHIFELLDEGDSVASIDGMFSKERQVAGCYIHGLFDEPGFRRCFINNIRAKKGLDPIDNIGDSRTHIIDKELDRLAGCLRNQLNIEAIKEIAGVGSLK